MNTTMDLLHTALTTKPAAAWHAELDLSRNALHSAKARGHLSPAIAGALAEKLGENVDKWIVIAALESEKDSACKTRMLKRFDSWRKRLLSSNIIVGWTSRVLCRGTRFA